MDILCVGVGGFIGSVLRYLIGTLGLSWQVLPKFPFGTFLVNIAGCLLIGFAYGLLSKFYPGNESLRLFIVVGVLGGFTTFSAFGYEAIELIRSGLIWTAALYVVASVLLGLIATLVGLKII